MVIQKKIVKHDISQGQVIWMTREIRKSIHRLPFCGDLKITIRRGLSIGAEDEVWLKVSSKKGTISSVESVIINGLFGALCVRPGNDNEREIYLAIVNRESLYYDSYNSVCVCNRFTTILNNLECLYKILVSPGPDVEKMKECVGIVDNMFEYIRKL